MPWRPIQFFHDPINQKTEGGMVTREYSVENYVENRWGISNNLTRITEESQRGSEK